MTFKKLLKALRNQKAYLRFCLFEADGWGSAAYHEGVETAQEMLDYWNQHPDEPYMDGFSFHARGYLHIPGEKTKFFSPSKEELQKLIERGY